MAIVENKTGGKFTWKMAYHYFITSII